MHCRMVKIREKPANASISRLKRLAHSTPFSVKVNRANPYFHEITHIPRRFFRKPIQTHTRFSAFLRNRREITMKSAKCQHFSENPAQNADFNADSRDFCGIRTLESQKSLKTLFSQFLQTRAKRISRLRNLLAMPFTNHAFMIECTKKKEGVELCQNSN